AGTMGRGRKNPFRSDNCRRLRQAAGCLQKPIHRRQLRQAGCQGFQFTGLKEDLETVVFVSRSHLYQRFCRSCFTNSPFLTSDTSYMAMNACGSVSLTISLSFCSSRRLITHVIWVNVISV